MKIMPYSYVKAIRIENNVAKGVTARVVIGKDDGASNFCMRVFEIAEGGNTPRHTHDWEHEMFVHAGAGEIYCSGRSTPVKAGSVAFIPGNEEHQIKNTGKELLVIACLIPSKAPEL
jgi:quercetin dioxygenase-like cupin family protein